MCSAVNDGKGEPMKAKWMVALSVLSVAAVLGAGVGIVAASDDDTETRLLLTDEQLADIRAMADELRANGVDRDLAMLLIEAQMERYITENLASYGLTEDEISAVMEQLESIGDSMAEIKEVAYELREQGATFDEVQEAVAPMMDDVKALQEQLVELLQSYDIGFNLPHPVDERPRVPQPNTVDHPSSVQV